jgi:hypothetical protein
MDQKAIRELAEIVQKALKIQQDNWNWNRGGPGISNHESAKQGGARGDLVPVVGLMLSWPADAQEWADKVAPRKTQGMKR